MPRPLEIEEKDRQFERFDVQIELSLFFPQLNSQFTAVTSNISQSEVIVTTSKKISCRLFSPVVIEFYNLHGPNSLFLDGYIVRIAPETLLECLSSALGFGHLQNRTFYYAIEFDPLDPKLESQWQKYLAQLKI